MTTTAARLLALFFVAVAAVLRMAEQLWIRPLSLGIDSWAGSLAAYLAGPLVALALPLGAYLLLVRRVLRRPATWEVEPGEARFHAGIAVGRTGSLAIVIGWLAGNGLLTERVPDEDRMRVVTGDGSLLISAVLVVVPLLVAAALLLIDRPCITLDQDAVTVQHYRRRLRVGWSELLPGGPPAPDKRNPHQLTVYRMRGGLQQPVHLPALRLQVDSAFLAHTLRYCTDNPAQRATIGTAAGLADLQASFARA